MAKPKCDAPKQTKDAKKGGKANMAPPFVKGGNKKGK